MMLMRGLLWLELGLGRLLVELAVPLIPAILRGRSRRDGRHWAAQHHVRVVCDRFIARGERHRGKLQRSLAVIEVAGLRKRCQRCWRLHARCVVRGLEVGEALLAAVATARLGDGH
jgi:hypothetical protein